ncbi:hypothetical protein [Aerolutibacter ruishenii]|uniref:hypothetical protein n=1 Tax=Aerolutibacter ruishenii TaxID=686800 RepID=UPI0011A2C2F5|nr:hypothetical protein [Lysobacter ruishenii]
MQATEREVVAELSLASGSISVTTQDLGAIKQALRSALVERERENPADYAPLLVELDAAPVWISHGIANLGPWKLTTREDRIVLVRRTPPTPTRLFHVATLERVGSVAWHVKNLEVEVVHPR